jgi:hypothetical protein
MLDPVRDRSPISNEEWPKPFVWHLHPRSTLPVRPHTFAREDRSVDAMNHRHRLRMTWFEVHGRLEFPD